MLKNEKIEVKIWNELSIARNNLLESKFGAFAPGIIVFKYEW